jgi:hypothetical protein
MTAGSALWSIETVVWSQGAPGVWDLTVGFAPGDSLPETPSAANFTFTDVRGVPRTDLAVREVTQTAPTTLALTVPAPPGPTAGPEAPDPSPIVLWTQGLEWVSPEGAFRGFVPNPVDARAADDPSPNPTAVGAPAATGGDIDYLSRDYTALRAFMLSRLAQRMPEAAADLEHAANPLTTLVETLATAGDYLAYSQDAVGTEAYLPTARTRLSVCRHARMLDYDVNEGCNARTWVRVTPDAAFTLPAGTRVVTPQPGTEGALIPGASVLALGTLVFETLYAAALDPARERFTLAPLADGATSLPAGATTATLAGAAPAWAPGQVVVFEPNPAQGGSPSFAAQVVRLRSVAIRKSAKGEGVTDLAWGPEDALAAPIPVSDDGSLPSVLVSGNLVLADHGATSVERLHPDVVPTDRPYRPRLPWRGVCWRTDFPADGAPERAAAACLRQDPRDAAPAVRLVATMSEGAASVPRAWRAKRDLLSATPFERVFAVEPRDGAVADLRFGDGVLGRRPVPGARFQVVLRFGGGPSGDIAARVLGQAIFDGPVTAVWNATPGIGGAAAESNEDVRQFAPYAFRRQRRAVTAQDFADRAREFPLVDDAGAQLDTRLPEPKFLVAVQPRPPAPASPAFYDAVAAWLAPFKAVGPDFEVVPPEVVGLDIALSVYPQPQADIAALRGRLARRFGREPGGMFSETRMALGRGVYLSELIEAALGVEGVAWVDADRRIDPRIAFGVLAPAPRDDLASGIISITGTQVARADNDPAAPENGRIVFHVMAGT